MMPATTNDALADEIEREADAFDRGVVFSNANARYSHGGLLRRAVEALRSATPAAAATGEPSREEVARTLCRRRRTSQCASICLSRFASSNRDGQCPDAVQVFGEDADAVIALYRTRTPRHEPAPHPETPAADVTGRYSVGDRVRKVRGSSWVGRVCGHYSTALTPHGIAVESEREPGSVQVYPEAAFEPAETQIASGGGRENG